jgi:hypothetical protein
MCKALDWQSDELKIKMHQVTSAVVHQCGGSLSEAQYCFYPKLAGKFAAREAGESIKPRVQRGFASATLGIDVKKTIPAREAGASIKPRVKRGFASATLGTGVLKQIQPAKRAADNRSLNTRPTIDDGSHSLSPASRASMFIGFAILGFRSQSLAPP